MTQPTLERTHRLDLTLERTALATGQDPIPLETIWSLQLGYYA